MQKFFGAILVLITLILPGLSSSEEPLITPKAIHLQSTRNYPSGSKQNIIGTWCGTVNEPGRSSYKVIMRIKSHDDASTEYPTLNCKGELSSVSTSGDTHTYYESITDNRATQQGNRCIDNTITIRLLDDQTMSCSWHGQWQGRNYTASATLKKCRP